MIAIEKWQDLINFHFLFHPLSMIHIMIMPNINMSEINIEIEAKNPSEINK